MGYLRHRANKREIARPPTRARWDGTNKIIRAPVAGNGNNNRKIVFIVVWIRLLSGVLVAVKPRYRRFYGPLAAVIAVSSGIRSVIFSLYANRLNMCVCV